MSDEEWQRWAATYAKEGRSIPAVMRRARTDRTRALLGVTVAYVLLAFLLVSGLRELRRAHTIGALAPPLFMMLYVPIVIVGLHLTMWGRFGRAGQAPLDLLADLERRHAGRRRLIRFVRWIAGIGVCGTIAVDAIAMLAACRFDLPQAFGTLATCAATVGFVWFTVKRVGRLIDQELQQAAEARRMLTEGDDGSGNDKTP
jgi:hypothetical protein